MSARSFLVANGLAAGLVVGTLAATADAQEPASSTWGAVRTAWGDPDLQGTWTNVTATPLERPRALEGKQVLTEEERAERFRQFTQEITTDTVPRGVGARLFRVAPGGDRRPADPVDGRRCMISL